MGRPGTGKTTLANQLAFAHVERGGKVAYVTLLAESHATMLANLRTMSFFEEEAVNRDIAYVGAYKSLRDDGLKGLLQLLRRIMRDEQTSMLFLDGVSPARAFAASEVALKEFIVELQLLSAMTRCTTVMLVNMTAEDTNGPEHTMVDGLIELAFERTNRRTLRTVELLKFRGTQHFLGRHEVTITSDGLTVYPRAEDVLDGHVAAMHQADACRTRVLSGIPQLDEMLGGGFLSGTMTVVLGYTGSGKTTLALQFLEAGAARGEPVLYFGFYEPPAHVLEAGASFGLELKRLERDGLFEQVWQPPYEHALDPLADRLISNVRRRRVRRVVIDGLDGFRQASVEHDRTIRFITAISNELRALDVTTLATEETHAPYGPEITMRIEAPRLSPMPSCCSST
jgi:circadian clock protein KaiC